MLHLAFVAAHCMRAHAGRARPHERTSFWLLKDDKSLKVHRIVQLGLPRPRAGRWLNCSCIMQVLGPDGTPRTPHNDDRRDDQLLGVTRPLHSSLFVSTATIASADGKQVSCSCNTGNSFDCVYQA